MKKFIILLAMIPGIVSAQHFIPLNQQLLQHKADTVVVISPYNVNVINNVFRQRNTLRQLIGAQEKTLFQAEKTIAQLNVGIAQRNALLIQKDSLLVQYRRLDDNNTRKIELLQKDVEKQKKRKRAYRKTTIVAIAAAVLLALRPWTAF